MTIHLESGAAEACIAKCGEFISAISRLIIADRYSVQNAAEGAFPTALQIGTVYELFTGKDLQGLLNGFVNQVRAMSALFAAAGGLIDAQDEALAAALGKATEAPPGMRSLGLMSELGSLGTMVDAAGLGDDPAALPVLGYQRVGPEEVSGASLAQMAAAAQALDAFGFAKVDAEMGEVASRLREATGALNRGLSDVLSGQWQGEFAQGASTSLTSFVTSADGLADTLQEVAHRAGVLSCGYGITSKKIAEQAEAVAGESGVSGGAIAGGVSREVAAKAATEQARAVVNTEYSPAVMDANLADLDFPTAYRVVSTTALGGPNGVDLARAWNLDGVVRPAVAAPPGEAALSAAAGGGTGDGTGVGAHGGAQTGVTTTSSPAATDAATEQALLGSRAGTSEAAGAQQTAGTGAGTSGTHVGASPAAGLNAATTAAAAPLLANQQSSQRATAAGPGGILGRGAGPRGRERERGGFGSAAGLLGGGAAASGAGAASRMGGAGTLAGLGSAAGAGGAGAGSATGAAPAGAFSSSSTSGGAAGGPRGGMVPAGMMGAVGGAGRDERRGHTPAGYLVNATNTNAIIGDPPKAAPAVLGRSAPAPDAARE